MFSNQVKENRQLLDKEIGSVADALNGLSVDDPEYKKTLKTLTKLYQLKETHHSKRQTELRDWMPVIGSVGAVLVIVTFEAFGHSVTSKALQFVNKPRAS